MENEEPEIKSKQASKRDRTLIISGKISKIFLMKTPCKKVTKKPERNIPKRTVCALASC